MKGFLNDSILNQSKAPQASFPQCGACGLYKSCKSPKFPVYGEGRKGIMIIDAAPTDREDSTGQQMQGKSAQLLRSALKQHGVDLERDCWKTNAIICRSENPPTIKQIEYCRPNLTRILAELKPSTIFPFGAAGCETLLRPYISTSESTAINQWAGWQIPSQALNAWICPTWKPMDMLISHKQQSLYELWWRRHITAALKLTGRPWQTIPDYRRDVEIILDAEQAARIILQMIQRGGNVAIDYETNRLKPDYPNARIVSCAVSWMGKRTISYPWHGVAIEATKELWLSDLGKIAANLKFEHRWTSRILGIQPRNWLKDVMLEAHRLDNRRKITGLRFQSFALLGFPSYDDHLAPFLSCSDARGLNQIHKVDMRTLCLYNGLDALLEFKVFQKQMEMKDGISY